MKINIKPYHFTELLNKGYSLDMMYILELIYNRKDVAPLESENKKIPDLISTLRRKELLMPDREELTLKGKELIEFINSNKGKILKKKVDENDDFGKWWSTYPSNMQFEHKGQKFDGLRSFRVRENDCRRLFESAINQGYTAEEMIEALKLELYLRREESIRTRENKYQYQQNSHTYLFKETYKEFVKRVRKGERAKEISNLQAVGGTDI